MFDTKKHLANFENNEIEMRYNYDVGRLSTMEGLAGMLGKRGCDMIHSGSRGVLKGGIAAIG